MDFLFSSRVMEKVGCRVWETYLWCSVGGDGSILIQRSLGAVKTVTEEFELSFLDSIRQRKHVGPGVKARL